MQIALDARQIYRSNRRGIGKTLLQLYRHVAQQRPDWQVEAFHRRQGHLLTSLPASIEPHAIDMFGDRFDAWMRWRLPLTAWQRGADLLHCPANICPTWLPIPTVVTIHDLNPLDFPQETDRFFTGRFEQSVRVACERAWIMCPSQYVATRLVNQWAADPNRLRVNPWAADPSIRPLARDEYGSVLAKHHLNGPFLLHFGSGKIRKNTRRVIEAWSKLKPIFRRHWQLLIVGLEGAGRVRAAQWTSQFEVESSVRLHGFMDESDIPALMSASSALVYPSLSEGFGLPILDAWAAHTPVLCSNTTSLPEVAGAAALKVEPVSVAAISSGLERLLEDESLCSQLLDAGERRLATYSWSTCAGRFVETVEDAMGKTSHYRAAA